MPKLGCLCGEVINLSIIPCPNGFDLLPERSTEPLVEALAIAHREAASERDFEKRVYAVLRDRALSISQVYECPHCHRLAVLRHASDPQVLNWYRPEREGEPIAKLQN